MRDSLLIRSVRLAHDPAAVVDLLVRDGRIAEIGPGLVSVGSEAVDGSGALALPGFVDAHCHVDKTLWGGPWVPHTAGPSVADRIANEQLRRRELSLPSADRATDLLAQMVACGTTYARTHTDVDPEIGLAGVEAVRDAVRRLDGRITVQQVAFPQGGILRRPGTAKLLEQAAAAGVEVVGGIDPAGYDGDPIRHLDTVFGIADRHGCAVDIHLHDAGELGAWEVELIIERTRALGLAGRVNISHAFGLCTVPEQIRDRLIDALAVSGVTLTTAAVFSRPVPPLAKLAKRGVTVAAGNDGVRDMWSPFGTGDMLERAMHLAYRCDLRRDDDIALALDAATLGGARVLGLSGYGLTVGCVADVVLVEARNAAEAAVAPAPRRLVVKQGRVVASGGRLV